MTRFITKGILGGLIEHKIIEEQGIETFHTIRYFWIYTRIIKDDSQVTFRGKRN